MTNRLASARDWVIHVLPGVGVALILLGCVTTLAGWHLPEPWRLVAQTTCLAGFLASLWRTVKDEGTIMFGIEVLNDTQGRDSWG